MTLQSKITRMVGLVSILFAHLPLQPGPLTQPRPPELGALVLFQCRGWELSRLHPRPLSHARFPLVGVEPVRVSLLGSAAKQPLNHTWRSLLWSTLSFLAGGPLCCFGGFMYLAPASTTSFSMAAAMVLYAAGRG